MARDTYDVFLSYARLDNQPETTRADERGWVDHFQIRLLRQLQKRGRQDFAFWCDVAEIEGKDRFSPEILEGLAKSHLFLPILSENYVQRPWCIQEIERFVSRKASEPDIDDRLLPVFKRPVDRNPIPPMLAGRGGYHFHRKDEIDPKKIIDLFELGEETNVKAYQEVLEKLANSIDLALPLTTPRQLIANPSQDSASLTVIVAPPADDVVVAHQKLLDELKRANIRVFPDDADDLLSADDAQERIV